MPLISKIFKRNKPSFVQEDDGRISFSEWYRLAQSVVNSCNYNDLDRRLWEAFPDNYSSENDPLLADVMSKLETGFIQDRVKRFTNRWNRGIENSDITEMRAAWLDLTGAVDQARSLIDKKRFPEYLSLEIDKQLTGTVGMIQSNIEITTRKAADETMSSTFRDAYYMVVKQRLDKNWSTEDV